MKPDNVDRAAMLMKALRDLDKVEDERALDWAPDYPGCQRVLEVGVFEGDQDGGTGCASLWLDLESGKVVLDFLKDWLRAELTKLGVELKGDSP